MWLLVVHFAVVFTAIFLLASHLEGAPYLGEREKNTPQRAPRGAAHLLLGGHQLLVLVREVHASVLGTLSHPPRAVVPGRWRLADYLSVAVSEVVA